MNKIALVVFVVSFSLLLVFLVKKAIEKDKKEAKKIILRFKFFLHPNAITIWGGITATIGIVLYFYNYPNIGISLFIFGIFADLLDGIVARGTGLVTDFGKKLDPLFDKIKLLIPLVYFGFEGDLLWQLVLVCVITDFLGQYLRSTVNFVRKIGLSFATAANSFGKIKTFLLSVLVIYCFLLKQKVNIPNIANYILFIVAGLAVLSLVSKFTRNRKPQPQLVMEEKK